MKHNVQELELDLSTCGPVVLALSTTLSIYYDSTSNAVNYLFSL